MRAAAWYFYPVRLVFKYDWDEWQEGQKFCARHTPCTWREDVRVVYKPLAAFSAKCLGAALLAHLISFALPLVMLLAWVLYLVAALGFLAVIYFAVFAIRTYRILRKSWRQVGRPATYKLVLDEDGVLFETARPSDNFRWPALTRYHETERLHILCYEKSILGIPKRALHDVSQEIKFWRTVRHLLPEGAVPPRPPKVCLGRRPTAPPVKLVPVRSFNGIGTALRSWKHFADGTAEAILWVCFLYLPLFPVKKYRVRVLSQPDREPRFSLRQLIVGLLSPHSGVHDAYEMIAGCPLEASEILNTYLYTYLWMPLLLALPLGLTFFVGKGMSWLFVDGSAIQTVTVGLLIHAWIGFCLFMLARELHRSRGGQK